MASLNRVILCGTLTRDPEISYTPGGMAICKFGLAVNERVKNQNDEWTDRPSFVDITVFGRQAETSNQYLQKGSPALLEGRLRWDSWEDKNGGGKRSKLYVVADRVQFLGGRQEEGAAGGGAPAASRPAPATPPPAASAPPMPEAEDDDDLPF